MRYFHVFAAIGRTISVAIAGALAFACTAHPETISGHPKVVDGDSLEIGAVRIRLHAVDAFEGRQTCRRNGAEWKCGAEAAALLRRLVGSGALRCERTDTDTYGRTVAICRNGATDVGAEMVKAGYALAYREFGDDYVDEEDDARAARRGAWAGEFVAPWDERHGAAASTGRPAASTNRPAPSADRPAPSGAAVPSTRGGGDCRGTGIKGNVNSKKEHIYHVPGSRSYQETKIDERKGERWFCTEQDAIRAGWRAPRG